MYATCSLGHQHWGPAGAAGGLVVAAATPGPRLLLTLRSPQVHQGDCWSIPGGAIDAGDADPRAAACREILEELEIDVSALPLLDTHLFECGGWTYTTVVLASPTTAAVSAHGWETAEAGWLSVEEVDRLFSADVLHPGFAASWPHLREIVSRVDA